MTGLQSHRVGITPAERVEWARLDLEHAVAVLASNRFRETVYVEAVVSRFRELAELRRQQDKHPGRGNRRQQPRRV